MAWEKSHSIVVQGVGKHALWRVWEDVNQWHKWDDDAEYAKLEGEFKQGNSFILKPKGGPKVKIVLERVVPLSSFTDVTSFPLAKMTSTHEMRETPSGLEVTHTLQIKGPLSFLWRKIVAEKIAAGAASQACRMIARARELQTLDGSA